MEKNPVWFTRVKKGRVEVVLDNRTRGKDGKPNLIVIGSFILAYSYHAERVCDYENFLIQNRLERVLYTYGKMPVAGLTTKRRREGIS